MTHYNLGFQAQLQGKLDIAVKSYRDSIRLNSSHFLSFHSLGDTYLKLEDWDKAIEAYRRAFELNSEYFWTAYNLGKAYTYQSKWDKAISAYRHSVKLNPGAYFPHASLKDCLLKKWKKLFDKGNEFLNKGERSRASFCYQNAIQFYKTSIEIPIIDKPRDLPHRPSILLIADDYLPQCFRYRVEQKIEQLEHAEIPVRCFPSRELEKARNEIHFAHIVLFYRVPAWPSMIEAIEYAKAIKKVVFYEIDDLIFDETHYPDPIESYGGLITKEQYAGLMRGTTLFREAMALCDYAIASTPALASEMEKVVAKKTAFLHRNALDSLSMSSIELKTEKIKRDYISIFYGSGTKAHNQDFDEIAAPAIAKIFEKHSSVRLVIVGYIALPEILKTHSERIRQVQLISDVELYWEFLKQADINIAVLHNTRVNNCKSEIKWTEAACFKVPSIVSATQTYLEVIEHGKNGFVVHSVEEWVKALDKLVSDPDLRIAIGEAAYRRVLQDYSLPAMAGNIKQVMLAGIKLAKQDGLITERSIKKRLLIVNVFYPPQSIGGATRVVKDNVEILQAQYSHQYEIFVFTTDHENPNSYEVYEYSYNGVHVTKVSTPLMEGMDWVYNDEQIYTIFSKYLEFNRPDLVHFHCIQRLTASVLQATSDKNIPFLVTVHDAWWISDYQFLVDEKGEVCDEQQNDPLVLVSNHRNISQSIRRQRYLREQLNKASAILAVSEAFTELYQRNGFPQTRANRNGIMPQPRLPRKPSLTGKVRIAHIGGIAAHKGYYLFKQAVEKANLTNCEVIVIDHALTIGSERREKWGSTPVKFLPKVSQDHMAMFYSTIDVLVAPSLWPESFGLVTREASAAGVWVVASDRGALAEDLQPETNGHIISPEDLSQFRVILKKIDSNPKKYQDLVSPNASIRTTECQVKELVGFYHSTIF